MDPEVIKMTPVTLAEVKNELNRIKKRDEELNFRGNKSEDYISSLHVISEKAAKELYSAIEKIGILRIKPEHIVKFIDILPSTIEETKYVVQSMGLTTNKENISNLFKVISEYLPTIKK